MYDEDSKNEYSEIDTGTSEELDLESILAEYKSSAYIAGDKKTPKVELDDKIELIISELQDGLLSDTPNEESGPDETGDTAMEPENEQDAPEEEQDTPKIQGYSWGELTEEEREFFGVSYASADAVDKYAGKTAEKLREDAYAEASEEAASAEAASEEVSKVMYGIDETDAGNHSSPGFFARFREKRRELYEREQLEADAADALYDEEIYGDVDESEGIEDEPTVMESSKAYASKLHSYQLRAVLALIICLFMGYSALAYGFNWPLPASFTENPQIFSIVLLALQLVVTLFGFDLFVKGFVDIIRLKSGALSLVSVSGLLALVDALHIILTQNTGFGLPYSAVAAFSMMFAIWGEALTRSAYKTAFRTAAATGTPNIVITEKGTLGEGRVIVKTPSDPRGFVTKAEQPDFAEYVYSFASPMLLIASLVLSALGSIGNGNPEIFSHTFSCLTAVSASFSSVIAFALPFSKLAKRLSKSGASIAGWWGACDIADAAGIVITDTDVFPAGTLSLNGMRILGGVSKEKLVSYTGSIIAVSGSGLSKIFVDLIKTQNCGILNVTEFSCYEGGGVGAIIRGERVLVGSSAFMNLMGIRLPPNLNAKNAVFTAINDELAGIFSVNYTPVKSVQSALISILESKLAMLFAVRDFNISPMMIKQKFKVSVDNMEYITVPERYRLSAERTEIKTLPSAILCREGLGPLSEVVTGGRKLKSAVRNCTVISVIGAVIGLLLMFYLCRSLAFNAASASNILFFMFTWLLPVLILSGGTGGK